MHKAAFDRIDAIAKKIRRHAAGTGPRASPQVATAAVVNATGSAPPYIVSACTPQAPV